MPVPIAAIGSAAASSKGGGGGFGKMLTQGITSTMKLGSSVLTTLNQISSYKAQVNSLIAQSQLLDFNAVISRNNAKLVDKQTVENTRLIRRQSAINKGAILDGFGRAGVSLSGSPIMQITELTTEDELAVSKSEFEGKVQSTNFINQANVQAFQAQRARDEAARTRREGRRALGASALNIGASFISGGGK